MIKRTFSLYLATILILSLCILPSCSAKDLYSEGDGEIEVLCTVFAPFDFARVVGGDRVTVTLLQDRGADLHNYTPTAATLDALAKADVFIYVGGVSDEKWVNNAITASGNTSLITLCLIDSVEQIHAELENDWSDHAIHGDHDGHDDHGTHSENNNHSHAHSESHDGHDHSGDEHIWTSLRNARVAVREIESALTKADPEGKDYFRANADEYVGELDALDKEYARALEDVSLLIFADRFPFVYLLHDYRVPYIAAFSGCSTEVNSSFEMQISLIEAVKANSAGAIFTIEGSDKSLAEAVANETGCRILTLDSMQSITRDEISSGAKYLEIMRQNLKVLMEVSD